MTTRRFVSLAAPLAVCGLLGAWIALSAANAEAASFSMLVYALANFIVYTDALDFALRLYMKRRHTATGARHRPRARAVDRSRPRALPAGAPPVVPVEPYAIIASVFNLEAQMEEFIADYAPYRDRMWLISDGSTDHTAVAAAPGRLALLR